MGTECGGGGDEGVLKRGRSLVWRFVGFQELLREGVDLVCSSDLVGQQRQLDYVEIFIKVLHL